ncbi:MAG: ankyrin repeat domain-containing protein [Nitrospira sp.]
MAKASTKRFRLKNGNGSVETLTGTYLDSGSIGEVFQLQSGVEVVKAYKNVTSKEKARVLQLPPKVQAMLAAPPAHQIIQHNGTSIVQIAWPQRLLLDEHDQIIGFSMRTVDYHNTISIYSLTTERSRARQGLRNDWTFRTYVARNLCSVISYVRKAGHLVVDFNPDNFRLHKNDGWITLLDCDGFAIRSGTQIIPAEAAHPDAVASEFRDPKSPSDFACDLLDDRQVRFGLAVLLFQLFNNGNLPTAGKHRHSSHEPTGVSERIKENLFSIDPTRRGLEPTGDQTHLLEEDTLLLFRRAFLGPAHDRPSAEDWRAHWETVAQKVRRCPHNAQLDHFSKPCHFCNTAQISAPRAQPTALGYWEKVWNAQRQYISTAISIGVALFTLSLFMEGPDDRQNTAVSQPSSASAQEEKRSSSSPSPAIVQKKTDQRAIVEPVAPEQAGASQVPQNPVRSQHFSGLKLDADKRAELAREKNASDLRKFAAKGELDVVKLLLEKGAAVNQTDQNGWSPLLLAAKNGHREVVELLVAKGAAAVQTDPKGSSPLVLAAMHGHREVVELLVAKGAAVNQTSWKGRSPLYFAAEMGHRDVVEALLAKGAAVNQTDQFGWSPLVVAAKNGHRDVVEILRKNGAVEGEFTDEPRLGQEERAREAMNEARRQALNEEPSVREAARRKGEEARTY